jgi:hypothetical protein
MNIVFETAKVDAKYKTNTKTDLLFLMHQGVYSDWILTGYMAFWPWQSNALHLLVIEKSEVLTSSL